MDLPEAEAGSPSYLVHPLYQVNAPRLRPCALFAHRCCCLPVPMSMLVEASARAYITHTATAHRSMCVRVVMLRYAPGALLCVYVRPCVLYEPFAAHASTRSCSHALLFHAARM
jgi:hypothetical protein